MSKVKAFLSRIGGKARFIAAMAVSSCFLALTSLVASAETGTSALATNKDTIINEFKNAAADITPIIVGVLGAGLGIFVIFVGIKLAKKMFTTVSK